MIYYLEIGRVQRDWRLIIGYFSKGMPSFDGSLPHALQVEPVWLAKLIPKTIIANIVNKAKAAIANAFSMPQAVPVLA